MNLTTATFGLLLLLTAAVPAQQYQLGSYGYIVNANYGSTLVVGGDYNGDGRTDYLVGSPNRSTTTNANIGSLTQVSGANGLVLGGTSGTRAGRRLGSAIAALGDVNGDGVPDFATSSPHDNAGGSNAGWVGCYSGATGLLLWEVVGPQPGSWFGQSVVGVPDMNGDGRMDIAVGAPRNNASWPSGRVYFYSGANGAYLRILTWGSGAEYFGHALALVGDQNGDNVPDLAVGAPNAGTVQVFRMGSPTITSVWASVGGAGFGSVLASAGDTNGDGVTDVLAGNGSWTYLLSGLTTQVIRSHIGASGELMGAALAGGLDLDADGRPDYVLGVPGASGGAGRVDVRSGRGGQLLFQISGAGDDAAGRAVALMPDRNGDGLAEVMFGLPGYDTNGQNAAGAVSVYGHRMVGRTEFVGSGCSGPFSSVLVTVDTAPLRFGGAAQATAPSLRPNAFGMWLVGLQPLAAPIDLTALGMPGCAARVAGDAMLAFTTNGVGAANLHIAIPNVPSFTGLRLEIQGVSSDPGANAAGFVVSQAWRLIVGNS